MRMSQTLRVVSRVQTSPRNYKLGFSQCLQQSIELFICKCCAYVCPHELLRRRTSTPGACTHVSSCSDFKCCASSRQYKQFQRLTSFLHAIASVSTFSTFTCCAYLRLYKHDKPLQGLRGSLNAFASPSSCSTFKCCVFQPNVNNYEIS